MTESARSAFAGLQTGIHIRTTFDKLFHELKTAEISGADGRRISVVTIAAIRFAHPAQCMERSKTGPLVVGISICVEESQRQFEMAVLNCEHQGTGTLSRAFTVWFLGLHRFVHISPGL